MKHDLEALMDRNDAVSSVRVPPGYQVTLYEDDGQKGESITFEGYLDDFSQDACQQVPKSLKDKTSSIVVKKL